MGFLLSKLLPLFIYPLGLAISIQFVALINRRRNWSAWCTSTALLLLTLPSMPIVSEQLVWSLEEPSAALTPRPIPKADAILVLGGGLKPALPPRNGVEMGEAGDRLLTGVRLLRQGKAPLLITSGAQINFNSNSPAPPEAISAKTLAIELGIPANKILINPDSRTTAEEAEAISNLGPKKNWNKIILVTSAIHMPRALASFKKKLAKTAQIEVIPVSCDFQLASRKNEGNLSFTGIAKKLAPDAQDLYISTTVIKEYIGLIIYRIKGEA
jgi:uncharacterized SAM-binding protein YcdF (DUF218 family)